jgi:protein tyrosine/serine phosphatase
MFNARAAGLLRPFQILEMIEFIRGMELPIWVHCKSGADRTGFFCVLYRHIRLGEPIEHALQELSVRYGHVAASPTGILDHFFGFYLSCRKPFQSFEAWVREDYDPVVVAAAYKPHGRLEWMVRQIKSLLSS